MGGSNPNSAVGANYQTSSNLDNDRLRFNAGSTGTPVQYQPTKGWDIQSTHPEALWNGIMSGIGSIAGAGVGAAKQGAAYHGQFGEDQMSNQGFYESKEAAQKAGIQNPQMWRQGTGQYGVEGTGWY